MFRLKLWFLPFLMLLPGIALFWRVTDQLAASTKQQLANQLASAVGTVNILLNQESNKLLDMANLAASSAEVRSALMDAQAGRGTERLGTALAEFRLGSGRFFMVVTKTGKVAWRTDKPDRRDDSLVGVALVRDGLGGVHRDGIWLVGDTFHRVAISPVTDKNGVLGAVLVADPITGDDAEAMAAAAKMPLALVADGKVLGHSLGAEVARVTDVPRAFGTPERPQDPFPLLHGMEGQYYGQAVPFVEAWPELKIAVAVPYAAAFEGLGTAQIWMLLLLGAGFFLALLWTVLLSRDVNAPLAAITAHLSAVTQGTQEGVLPESAVSGPYVRLAKLINMVLDKRVPTGRTSLDSMLGGLTGPAPAPASVPQLDLPPPSPPPLGTNPSSASNGGGLQGLFDAPPPPPPQLAETEDPFARFDEPAMAPPPPPQYAPPPPPPQYSAPPPPPQYSAPPPPQYSAPPPPPQYSAPPASYARPAPPPPPPPPQMYSPPPARPEATVMMQIPQELLDASASPGARNAPAPSRAPPPPPRSAPPPPPSEATVMVQVPQELLAQTGAMDEEQAHFREVYAQFVRTREQCGEPAEDLTFERFAQKLNKNKQQLVEKYGCRTVRFQVYVKAGKAALKAVPVRE